MKSKNNRQPPQTTANASAASLNSDLPSMQSVQALGADGQVTLYVSTENRVRIGFLLQGKILSALGAEGTALLTAAGIKQSSLANARSAQWVLETFISLTPKVFFHPGGDPAAEPVEFSEAFYDSLTLHDCELLKRAFSNQGIVKYRPTIAESRRLVTLPGWQNEIETWFEHGTDTAGLRQREEDTAAALQAERDRQAELERQVQQLQQTIANASSLPPPPPSVPAPAPAPAPAPVPAARSEASRLASSDPAPQAPGSMPQDDPQDPANPHNLTPDEIGQAVHDATDGMHVEEDDEDDADAGSETESTASTGKHEPGGLYEDDNDVAWCDSYLNDLERLLPGTIQEASPEQIVDLHTRLQALTALVAARLPESTSVAPQLSSPSEPEPAEAPAASPAPAKPKAKAKAKTTRAKIAA